MVVTHAGSRVIALIGDSGVGKTRLVHLIAQQLGLALPPRDSTATRWCTAYSMPLPHDHLMLNVLDTPGHPDFRAQRALALSGADAALLVVSARGAPWDLLDTYRTECEQLKRPMAIVILRDADPASQPEACLSALRDRWGRCCVPIDWSNASRKVVDLLGGPWPSDLDRTTQQWVDELEEDAAGESDIILEKYVSGEHLAAADLVEGLRTGFARLHLQPVFEVDRLNGEGVDALIHEMARLFPESGDRGCPAGSERVPNANGFACARVLNVRHDRFAGTSALVRICAGHLEPHTSLWNASQSMGVRLSSLQRLPPMQGDAINSAASGDLVFLHKVDGIRPGDWLTTDLSVPIDGHELRLDPVVFEQALQVSPTLDAARLVENLQTIVSEDPSMSLRQDAETHEWILGGYGDVQLSSAMADLRQRSNADVQLADPSIHYRESIRTVGEARYRHRKQSGGHGQYAEVQLRIAPWTEADDDWFHDALQGTAVPRAFLPAIRKGVMESMAAGPFSGWPVVHIRVDVVGGSAHEVDSSELAFKIAAAHALSDALMSAQPLLLEPVLRLHLHAPDRFTGMLTRDISQRRGRILDLQSDAGHVRIDAEVPEAEARRYAVDLKSMTHGTGCLRSSFVRYEPAPLHVAAPIVAQWRAKRNAHKES